MHCMAQMFQLLHVKTADLRGNSPAQVVPCHHMTHMVGLDTETVGR